MHAELILVCHASTAAVRSARFPADEPLDDAGRVAAARAARTFLRGPPESVCCAPSIAARQTAEALTLAASLEPALADCAFGRWAGRPLAEVAREEPDGFTAWMTDPDWEGHGGETRSHLQRRISTWVDRRHTTGRTLAITHPAVIRAAIIYAIEATPATFWHLDIGPLSQTHLHSNGDRWTLRDLRPHT